MKVVFISYGDHNYFRQLGMLHELAARSTFFSNIRMYTPRDICHSFKSRFSQIYYNEKGGGYWIWKPYILQETLTQLNEGDILVYCDAGCLINDSAKGRFDEYVEILNNSPSGSLAFQLTHMEFRFTKSEAIRYFSPSEQAICSGQLVGGIVLIKKNSASVDLIGEFYNTLFVNPSLFTDEMDAANQRLGFVSHRHDQSVFSLLRKQHESFILPDETWFKDFARFGKEFPFWAARISDDMHNELEF